MNCQIEFANDDVGMPCGKLAAKCLTAAPRFVLTVAWSAAEIHFADFAMTTT